MPYITDGPPIVASADLEAADLLARAGRPSASASGWIVTAMALLDPGQMPVPVPRSPEVGGNYAVASSPGPAPARRARTSPMVRSRLSISGSGRCSWIW